jgi:hypothetical protein
MNLCEIAFVQCMCVCVCVCVSARARARQCMHLFIIEALAFGGEYDGSDITITLLQKKNYQILYPVRVASSVLLCIFSLFLA